MGLATNGGICIGAGLGSKIALRLSFCLERTRNWRVVVRLRIVAGLGLFDCYSPIMMDRWVQ